MYAGTFRGSKVCVKYWVYSGEDQQEVNNVRYRYHHFPQSRPLMNPQRFYRAAVVWKQLAHQNIVPLLGVTTAPLRSISDWMSEGTLGEYIKEKPRANRLGLVGDLPLLRVEH